MGYFRSLTDEQLKIAYAQVKEVEEKSSAKNKESWPIKYDTYLYKATEYYDRYVSMPVSVAINDLKFEIEKRGILNDCKRI